MGGLLFGEAEHTSRARYERKGRSYVQVFGGLTRPTGTNDALKDNTFAGETPHAMPASFPCPDRSDAACPSHANFGVTQGYR